MAYERELRLQAQMQSGQVIFNGSIDHARSIILVLAEFAETSIRIFCNSLNPSVYAEESLISQLKTFLAENGRVLEIIVEDDSKISPQKHPLITEFHGRSDVHFRKLDPEIAAQTPFHFSVSDRKSYRFEDDKRAPRAIAAFGDTSIGEHLDGLFSKLWENSTEIDWSAKA